MTFPYIMYCDGQPFKFATTLQNAWENHDFKNAISHDMYMQCVRNFKGLL